MNSQCTDFSVTCKSYFGQPGDTSISCQDSSLMLVSCGIRIDYPDLFISRGTSMNDVSCTIHYHTSFTTKRPTSSPTSPTTTPTISNTSITTNVPTLDPTVSTTLAPSSSPTDTLDPTFEPTLEPTGWPTVADTVKPIPYAQCCKFSECYSANFECQLEMKRSQASGSITCSNSYPHLISCGIEQRYEDSTITDVFKGVIFDTDSNLDILGGYYSLFNLTTQNPTMSPTVHPTSTPQPTDTANQPTSPPTSTTTTESPTHNPTILGNNTGLRDFSETYTYSQQTDGGNACSAQRFELNNAGTAANVNWLWLYSVCCTEKFVDTLEPTPNTAQPTPSPTPSPTGLPTTNEFSEEQGPLFETRIVWPLTITLNRRNKSIEFQDFGNGPVRALRWGISNISRQFTYINDNWNEGIKSINDTELNEYFFTIKWFRTDGANFTSEYGRIFLEDATSAPSPAPTYSPTVSGEPPTDTTTPIPTVFNHRYDHSACSDIPYDAVDQIDKIHIYINDTTEKILGMSMYRTTINETYTCHVDMAQNNSDTFVAEIINTAQLDTIKYNNNTIDYSQCGGSGAGLAGFFGAAPDFGIDYIGFEFASDASALTDSSGCRFYPTTTTTTAQPSLSPSPDPSHHPSSAPSKQTTATPTATDQYLTTPSRYLYCYYVMDKENASCIKSNTSNSGTVQKPTQQQILTNPSFMTGCIGFSVFDQPNSWYIENDTCFVNGRDSEYIAAIATCCALIDPEPSTETSSQIGVIIGIIAAGIVVVAIWVGFTIFCVKQSQRAEKQKELDTIKEITDADGNVIGIDLTKEQIELRKDLSPFAVTEQEHREMLRAVKQNSAENIGLI